MSKKKYTPQDQPEANEAQTDDTQPSEDVVAQDEALTDFDVSETFPTEDADVVEDPVVEAPVVEAPAVEPPQSDSVSEYADYTSEYMASAPEGLSSIGYKLGGYVDAMQPNVPHDENGLQKNQLKLRGVINNVLDLADDRFGDGLKFLARVIRAHRTTVFSETMIFRGFDRMRVSRGERQRLETLISLLLATADVKNPKDVNKSVDMKVVYRFVTDNNQQQKLQSFYGG